MFTDIAFSLFMATHINVLDYALTSTEPPSSARAAYTMELISDNARRVIKFDPRLPAHSHWQVVISEGEDVYLDKVSKEWGATPSPDSRLFPDNLRSSMNAHVDIEDMGSVWRARFQPTPHKNSDNFDMQASKYLVATAWIEPVESRILRVDYIANEVFPLAEGGEVTKYLHTYLMATDPNYRITFISAFQIDMEGHYLLKPFVKRYSAQILEIEIFFTTTEEEQLYIQERFNKHSTFAKIERR